MMNTRLLIMIPLFWIFLFPSTGTGQRPALVQSEQDWPLPVAPLLPHHPETVAIDADAPGTLVWITEGVDAVAWTLDTERARIGLRTDAGGLYIEAHISDTDLRTVHGTRDELLHEGDVFEIFLQCATNETFYIEIQIAPNGTVADLLMLDRYWGRISDPMLKDWDARGLELKVEALGTINDSSDVDTGYRIRCRIPPHALVGRRHWPPRGETWRANFMIIDHSASADKPGVWQWSASLREGGFPHDPERFGFIHTAPAGKVSDQKSEDSGQ